MLKKEIYEEWNESVISRISARQRLWGVWQTNEENVDKTGPDPYVLLKDTTTWFSLSDHDILSREWRVIVDQVQIIIMVGLW